MYIRRVVLSGIKGFDNADLSLVGDDDSFDGWSVITGENGAGKTAFLKAIALALLGPDQAASLVPDFSGWITDGLDSGTISVEVLPDHDHDKTRKGGFPVAGTFWAEIEIRRSDRMFDVSSADIFRNKKKGALNGPWQSLTPGWFSVGYGPFRRLYGSSPDAQRLMMLPGRVPRYATLFKEDATLAEGEEWVKTLNYRRLEQNKEDATILDALLNLVGDNFLRQGVAIDAVNSDGIWMRDSAGRKMPLSDMSEGYRSALAMLIDIFRHMVSVFGSENLLSRDEDGRTFIDRPGVVMIDEIDAHLHPAWQREIGFWLKNHLPRIQFIVTTHSPLVCQAADAGRIYHMPTAGSGEPFKVSHDEYRRIITGKPDEILLTPAFNLPHTRSPRTVRARERRARLVAKERKVGLSPEEKREFEQLDLFAGVLGE
ncbi:AAA family ATPase [Prauserella cavernicola]|uniref:AAA family ATPase n=1 Tax=Prauserella cavernicola TaxID=2800127 RepID=A0A934QS16_9PSEU|nr:AAA family ATPase [Prauserella cavernicola]MBK1785237.1 AAA family ATPase [Prauserella cavernicola]